MINLIISTSAWVIVAIVMATAGIHIYDWQFWAIDGCMLVVSFAAFHRGLNK